jgi:hypothetical protein
MRRRGRAADRGALWSISALADEFGQTRTTVRRRLRDVEPAGTAYGHPVWRLADAVPALFGSLARRQALDGFSPKDRKDWVASERDLMKLRQEAGELVPVEEVRELAAGLVRPMADALDSLADVLEREAGLSPQQVESVIAVCTRVRAELHRSISE